MHLTTIINISATETKKPSWGCRSLTAGDRQGITWATITCQLVADGPIKRPRREQQLGWG